MHRLTSLVLFAASACLAQQAGPFGLRFQQGQNVSVIGDGATLTLPADAIGLPVSGSLFITYRGASTTVTINSFDITGSADFTISGFGELPLTVRSQETLNLTLRYQPTTGNRTSARLTVSYTEGRTTASFTLNLTGTAPDFAFSYTPPGGNAQPLVSGGVIRFPQTVVDTTANATLLIINRGSGAGVINAITKTGDAFELIGAPLPGTSIDGGRDLRLTVAFTPKQLPPSTGSITIELVNRQVTFALEGTGSAARFTYEVISSQGAAAVQPDQTIVLPDTLVGERSSVQVRVTNSGNADGRIATIAASGSGVTLTDLPPLPQVLSPGGRFSFTIVFSPTQAGRVTGLLRIGSEQFELAANALGPVLTYSYVAAGVNIQVQNNGTVNFVPTSVGASSSLQFQITNTGTARGAVNNISITAATTVFELTGLPSLPASLDAGESVSFSIRFAPVSLGGVTATLRVDAVTFTLTGTGTSPAPLPGYRFGGASGVQEPLQQPAVSLTLSAPYPLDLNGVLTLNFNSEVFSNDPAVQFATGGRTVNFTIPANTTQALFPNNATQIRLQTGSVAGTIVLTPSFKTDGGIDLTPTRPESLVLTVAQGAPRLLSVTIAARTSTSITLQVSGFSTSRSVTQMDLQFTPVAGESLATTRLSIGVEAAFLAWYQSQQSQQFGSLFTATVPLTLSGEVNAVTSLADAIQSISVTISNRSGASAARSVDLK